MLSFLNYLHRKKQDNFSKTGRNSSRMHTACFPKSDGVGGGGESGVFIQRGISIQGIGFLRPGGQGSPSREGLHPGGYGPFGPMDPLLSPLKVPFLLKLFFLSLRKQYVKRQNSLCIYRKTWL